MSLLSWLQNRFWNPANLVDLRSRYRHAAPGEQIRFAHAPPRWLHMQDETHRARYYRDLNQTLRRLDPETVGVESLVAGLLTTARLAVPGQAAGQMRALRGVVAGLCAMGEGKPLLEAVRMRKAARSFAARWIAPLAETAARSGQHEAALEGFRAMADTGAMAPAHLRAYSEFLSRRSEVAPPDVLHTYLQCLEAHEWRSGEDPLLRRLEGALGKQLRIEEYTPSHDVPWRLPLLARMQTGQGNRAGVARSLGLGYLLIDQPGRAVAHLQRASRLDGAGGETHFLLAQGFYRLGRYEEAAETLATALEHGYPRSRISVWQGLSLARSGRWQESCTHFAAAEVELGDEADASFHLYWARACFRTGAVDDARQRFEKAAEVAGHGRFPDRDPFDRARAQHGLAVCLCALGNTEGAQALLMASQDQGGGFAPAAHLLGHLLRQAGRSDEALSAFRRAVALSPRDPVYRLSLGLALDDATAPEAADLMAALTDEGLGGAELPRRLMLACQRGGRHAEARKWLARLVRQSPDNVELSAWVARYAASAATEAFNQARYAESAALWQQVADAGCATEVAGRHALALLCEAARSLKSGWGGDLDSIWPALERAHRLAPSPLSRLWNAIGLLARGAYGQSAQEFAALGQAGESSPAVPVLHALARYMDGESAAFDALSAAGQLPGLPGLDVLLGLMRIQGAAASGDFEHLLTAVEAWLQLPDSHTLAASLQGPLNALVWTALRNGFRQSIRRRIPIQRLLDKLAKAHAGFWLPADAIVRTAMLLHGKKPAEVGLELLVERDRAIMAAQAALPELQRGALMLELAGFLRIRVSHAVLRGQLVDAQGLLERLSALPSTRREAVSALQALIARRLEEPSHAKAYALVETQPDEARRVWLLRLEHSPEEVASLEHLACLAWTRAFDAGKRAVALADRARATTSPGGATAQRKQAEAEYAAAIEWFGEGLEHFGRLYRIDEYWEALRSKGRALATENGRFREEEERAFDAWRANIMADRGQVLVNLAIHLMDRLDKQGLALARAAMARLRSAGLPAAVLEQLADALAVRLAGNDESAFAGTGLQAELAKVRRVLDVDPVNVQALELAVRGCALCAGSAHTDAESESLQAPLAESRPLAKQLEQQLPGLVEERRKQARRRLAAYWENLGTITFGVAADVNNAIASSPGDRAAQFQRLKPRICRLLRDAQEALGKACEFDPTVKARVADYLGNIREAIDHLDC